jgi:Kef-type K+ transport system membrane component KefB
VYPRRTQVLHHGVTLATASSAGGTVPRVLLAIAVIVAVARVLAWAFGRLRQPPVVGELLAGLLLGPTVLGALPGDLTGALFPEEIRRLLDVVGNLGLVLFMFLIGLELDLDMLRRRSRSALTISLASVGVPFILGLLLAFVLYPAHRRVGGHDVAFAGFALFIGTALSVTAFPVLARILADAGLRGTGLGTLVLACAAIEDVIAWALLTLALAVATAQGLWEVPRIVGGSVVFAATAIVLGRPLLAHVLARGGSREIGDHVLIGLAVCGTACSAWITGAIGVHVVLGAVIFGIAFPRQAVLRARLHSAVEPLTVSVLLPVFFALPGLGLDLGHSMPAHASELVLILAVACAGKLAGAAGAARAVGIPWREATAIGVLINTRGLMELVVLNVGHAAGIIDDQLYGLFVVMAVTTTLAAGPVLRTLYRADEVRGVARRREQPARPPSRARRARRRLAPAETRAE